MTEPFNPPKDDDSVVTPPPTLIERIIPPRALALRLFVDFNPFYILSAICMLFGVFALNNSFTWEPIPSRNLLNVLAMINVYEFILIGLALVRLRRSVRRDAMVLLLIETFFLADVGFLNIELFGLGLKLGLTVNALVLLAAAVKALILLRAARISLTDGRLFFLLIQLGVLFVLPGVIAIAGMRNDTFVHPLVLYAGWWVTALLPVAYVLLAATPRVARLDGDEDARAVDSRLPSYVLTEYHARILTRVLLLLPMLSIIAHLSLCHWVYKVVFHPADVAPLLIGAAFAVGRCDGLISSLAMRMRVQLALPVLAVVLCTFNVPEKLVFGVAHVPFSPLRLTMMAAAVVYLDALWLYRHLLLALAVLVCGTGMVLGYSVVGIKRSLFSVVRWCVDVVDRLTPRTLHDWGVVSIGAAFVLLALGAMVSLSRRVVVIHGDQGEEDETT